HATARVANPHLRKAIDNVELYVRVSAARRKLRSVLQEIPDHLSEPRRITVYEWMLRSDFHIEPNTVLNEEEAIIFDRPAHQRTEIEALALEENLAARDPRGIEQIVDEPRQLIDLPFDHHERALGLLAARSRTVQNVEAVADGRERIPELVRKHRQE